MNEDEILLDILRTGRRWHEGKMTLTKAESIIKEDIDSYNVVKNLTIPIVVQQSELLIGLLTMLEKEGGNEFINKAEIVAKYQANL